MRFCQTGGLDEGGFIEYPPQLPGKPTNPATVAELRVAIEQKCSQIPNEMFLDVCNSIASCYQQYLDQNEHQFENIC